jgi:hypothetical protein
MVKQNLSFKLTIGLIALALAEGILKASWPAFPLTETFAFQGLIAGSWFTKRAFTDAKGFKYGNNKTPSTD